MKPSDEQLEEVESLPALILFALEVNAGAFDPDEFGIELGEPYHLDCSYGDVYT